ncbi:DUF3237 domain-containing protein [Salipiger sp. IMCC34102]|uniref:DUF3237 domain-containing protein n=1 Tax=Salipiger sp. IMCC34102 TaxID=2510647 RepID=UPI00101DF281|nr:DUF3237 domain-containing protein [Salipiger sp. IMCC34102]RYH02648.1 DUF3237 domain-containing protein [Salipiger sp. IMCC34102]
MTAPVYRPIGTFHVLIAPPVMVGPMHGRMRACVPITGGTLTGPDLDGTILPGGYDWAWLSEDGRAEVEARYVLDLGGGAFATIVNRGTCAPVAGDPDTFAGHSVPVFETGDPAHDWLNHGTFVCSFVSRMADGHVNLELFKAE